MEARMLAVQHGDDGPPGWFGDWLAERGVDIHVVAGHRGEAVPEDLSGFDGLIVLGGSMGAYDDVAHPWLGPTKRLIARAVAEQTAFLGICLGHQLAAVALGGTVTRNPAGRTVGLRPVGRTSAGRADDLFTVVPARARALQWNDDVVAALPPAATALALAADGSVQAARFGPRAWGVQFHPECTPEIAATWAAHEAGHDARRVAAGVAAARAELRETWRPLAHRLADLVCESAAARVS